MVTNPTWFEIGPKDTGTRHKFVLVPSHSDFLPVSLTLVFLPFYFLNFTLYPNRIFHQSSPNASRSLLLIRRRTDLLYVIKRLAKRDRHLSCPRPDTVLYIRSPFPCVDVLWLSATFAGSFWCKSPGNGTGHWHPESTLCSLPHPLCLSHLCPSPSLSLPRTSLSFTL